VFRWQKHKKQYEKALGPISKLRLSEARAIAAQYSADIFHGRLIGAGNRKGMTFATMAEEGLPVFTEGLTKETAREWHTSLLRTAAPFFEKTPLKEINLKPSG